MAGKSILEQALLQVESLEEAVKQNAKGILGSVMKQELNGLLKESMEKEMSTEQEDTSLDDDDDDTKPEKDVTGNEMSDDDEYEEEDDEEEDDEEEEDDYDMPSDDNMAPGSDMPSDDDMTSGSDMPSDDSVMDMTGASDEEVLKVFKAMKPEDGIIVKKDGDNLEIEINDDEYIIKLDSMNEEDMEDDMYKDDMYEDDMYKDEEDVYEITLDDEEMMDQPNEGMSKYDYEDESNETDTYESEDSYDGMDTEKIEATEAARTKWNPHGGKRTGIKSKKLFKAGSDHGSINEEMQKLKKQNGEYKKALILFKDKLNEVAVFNASLAYATRIFTEHSTTKGEKLNILKRFDSVSSINECKNLYSAIKTELGSKKPVSESVVEKITSTPKTSTSKEVLSESKAYENPQFKRMKELMVKIK